MESGTKFLAHLKSHCKAVLPLIPSRIQFFSSSSLHLVLFSFVSYFFLFSSFSFIFCSSFFLLPRSNDSFSQYRLAEIKISN